MAFLDHADRMVQQCRNIIFHIMVKGRDGLTGENGLTGEDMVVGNMSLW